MIEMQTMAESGMDTHALLCGYEHAVPVAEDQVANRPESVLSLSR